MIYVLILLALLGFLPLVFVLVRKYRNDRLAKNGVATTGTITQVFGVSLNWINLVQIEYHVVETGKIISKRIRVPGIPYSVGDRLPLLYDKNDPSRMQLHMKNGFIPLLIFTIIIAIFILWACFKVYKMVLSGAM